MQVYLPLNSLLIFCTIQFLVLVKIDRKYSTIVVRLIYRWKKSIHIKQLEVLFWRLLVRFSTMISKEEYPLKISHPLASRLLCQSHSVKDFWQKRYVVSTFNMKLPHCFSVAEFVTPPVFCSDETRLRGHRLQQSFDVFS